MLTDPSEDRFSMTNTRTRRHKSRYQSKVPRPKLGLQFIPISIVPLTGAFAPLSPPNSGGRPEFEVPPELGDLGDLGS